MHTRYTHACGVCGLFSWSMAGLLAFSSRQFALTFSLSASHYFSFLSKRNGRRMPPAERSALHFQYIYIERELLGASGGRSDGIHKTATTYLRQHHTTREAAQAARPAACVVRGAT